MQSPFSAQVVGRRHLPLTARRVRALQNGGAGLQQGLQVGDDLRPPADTATINFEGSRSMVWVMESLTAVPLGSSSSVHCDSPSLELGLVL